MRELNPEGDVILIDKPLRWTSFDVVKKLKGILKVKKAGHAGTLDPLATGLLVICTGKKTKGIAEIQDAEKEYTGTFILGAVTPSFDLETGITQTWDVSKLTKNDVESAVLKLTGTYSQMPPMHSAVKAGGQRAYTLARKGETAVLNAKNITVSVFEIIRLELPELQFRIVCTKGTYIRAIARDLGELLSMGAYMSELKRTRIGQYSVEDAVHMDDLSREYSVESQKADS